MHPSIGIKRCKSLAIAIPLFFVGLVAAANPPATDGNSDVKGLHVALNGTAIGFSLNFECQIKDRVRCENARNAFVQALKILSNVLDLKRPITVDAKFRNFCDSTLPGAMTDDIVGYARPTLVTFVDPSDNKARLYPQALYKQLNELKDPFKESDIIADFHAGKELYFYNENRSIRETEIDFVALLLHELTHGLGFATAWRDRRDYPDSKTRLRPSLSFDLMPDNSVSVKFLETIFDKYLIDSSGNSLSVFTDNLNELAISMKWILRDMWSSLEKRPGYQQIAEHMGKLVTIPGSISFHTKNKKKVLLETSLVPYQPGSSLSHVDYKTFHKTTDFLMQHETVPGHTLAQVIHDTGAQGPLGPLLLEVLETIGYTVREQAFPLESFDFLNKENYPGLDSPHYLWYISLPVIIALSFLIYLLCRRWRKKPVSCESTGVASI